MNVAELKKTMILVAGVSTEVFPLMGDKLHRHTHPAYFRALHNIFHFQTV